MNQINIGLSRQRDTLQALRPLSFKVLSDTIVSFFDLIQETVLGKLERKWPCIGFFT